MKVEQKLQIDAIKGERIYYYDFGELTLISDGYIGVYLKQSELKIDKTKLIKIVKCDLDPELLKNERTEARVTRTAHISQNKLSIKIKSKENEGYCFVQEKLLKQFYGYNGLYIKSKKDIVYVTKYGVPYGIILPVYIAEELE